MALEKKSITQLKVDNWGSFFLYRLQLLFAKGDKCDLTLKFTQGEELKVHKLVLNTCTSHFEKYKVVDNAISLPDHYTYATLQPIVNFMYCGKLEYKPELHDSIHDACKTLGLTILTKLLQAKKADGKAVEVKGKIVEKRDLSTMGPQQTQQMRRIANDVMGSSSLASFGPPLLGKKLPIWRRRAPLMPLPPPEDPRPTRFEWPSEDAAPDTILFTTTSFTDISYDSMPVIQSPAEPPPPPPPPPRVRPPKRQHVPIEAMIPAKGVRRDDRGNVIQEDDDDDEGHFENLHDFDDSDEDNEESEVTDTPPATSTPKPILKSEPRTSSTPAPVTPAAPTTPAAPAAPAPQAPTTQPPAKKVRFSLNQEASSPASTTAPAAKASPAKVSPKPQSKTTKLPNAEVSIIAESGDKLEGPNHAKIIAEVLKKYPQLVKSYKSIKLKITSPASTASKASEKSNQVSPGPGDKGPPAPASKSSYLVMPQPAKEPEAAPAQPPPPPSNALNPDNKSGPWFCRTCNSGNSGAEDSPLGFSSYFDYRKHFETVHAEKVDSRICEFCGYKASKRNLHLFHLYTKHDIPPPRNIKFPKCDQCPYVALSESLLLKHQHNHQATKELTCTLCNTVFRSASSLQAHSVTCSRKSEPRHLHACDKCHRAFRTSTSLNAHVKVCQGPEAAPELEQEPQPQPQAQPQPQQGAAELPQQLHMIEVPVLNVGRPKQDQSSVVSSLVQLPTGLILAETPNMTLIPTSEANGLSTLATPITPMTPITTSIGLTVSLPEDQTVILLDEDSELFLQGNNSVMVSTDTDVQEYIVPDLTGAVSHIYTSEGIQYAVSGSSIMSYPIMHVQQQEADKPSEEVATIQEVEPQPAPPPPPAPLQELPPGPEEAPPSQEDAVQLKVEDTTIDELSESAMDGTTIIMDMDHQDKAPTPTPGEEEVGRGEGEDEDAEKTTIFVPEAEAAAGSLLTEAAPVTEEPLEPVSPEAKPKADHLSSLSQDWEEDEEEARGPPAAEEPVHPDMLPCRPTFHLDQAP